MKTCILVGALVLGFAGTAASTAMADEYYVVESPTTHRCTITTERPADKQVVTQIGPVAFATREEAQDRIKTTKVCSDTTTGSGTVVKEKEIERE